MNKEALEYATVRFRELLPLVESLAPGDDLYIEHLPVSITEMERIRKAGEERFSDEDRERISPEQLAKIQRLVALLQKHREERIDEQRVYRCVELGLMFAREGYTVGWEDIDSSTIEGVTENDLRALNFERDAFPTEGSLLLVRHNVEA